jgi:hypothetical protein
MEINFMIKELFTFIKLLFKTSPINTERVELMGMNHFPFKGYKYLMWCGKMIYRNDMGEKRKKEWKTPAFKKDLNHETIHLNQAKRSGSWLKYYWQYFIEWVKGGIIMAPVSAAYYTNPFEMEAYANEDKPEYPEGMIIYEDNYSTLEFTKYIIKNGRKKVYKNAGGTLRDWKEYIKSI